MERIIPLNLPLSVAFAGLYFFLIAPHFVVSQIIRETNGAGLSLFQFLEDKRSGNPRYFWLRRGIRGVERQLRNSGLSVSPGVLFHGVAFALFKERLPNDELQAVGEWLIHPANFQVVNSIIPGLIWQSKQAKDEGFGKAPGVWDQLVEIWQKFHRATSTAGKIATALAAIIGVVLTILRLIKP